MTTSHTAHGLASLGRHGDTMLVHMSPHEVVGLNYLAKKQGTSLTINPETGLPEAFNLGSFFSSFLPTLAGMAFAPATGGFSMAPLLAGAATGAAMAGIQGKDPLMGGLMGGLGGYGGGQLGPALGAAAPGGYVAGQAVQGAANPLMNTAVNTTLSGAGSSMMTNPLISNAANSMTQAGLGAGSGVGFMDKATQNIMNAGSGLKNIATGADQAGAWNAFKAAGGTGTQLAMPVGGAVLSGLEESDIYGNPINMDEAKRKQAYDPSASLNLGNDTGLRLIAEGGYINGYANGGVISNPSVGSGIADLYNRPEGQTSETISQDGYGIGRLGALSNAESMNNARVLGYAMGGPISFADGGSTDPLTGEIQPIDQSMGLASLTPPATSQAMPTQQVQNAATALSGEPNSGGSIISQVTANLRADPNYQPKNPIEASIVNQIKGSDPMQQGQASQQGLGSIAPSQPMAPSFNPSTAMTPTYYAGMNAPQGYAEGGDVGGAPSADIAAEIDRLGIDPSLVYGDMVDDKAGLPYTYDRIFTPGALDARRISPIEYNPYTYAGATRKREGMARGGYLNGQGDGMSDSIPATIEGKQPARLADGEFVVPADVVSHIGNGSSKAGSQRLYSMLDKVRKARTGNKKQGKQINPNKYMPA